MLIFGAIYGATVTTVLWRIGAAQDRRKSNDNINE
jgi:hypothetical protein